MVFTVALVAVIALAIHVVRRSLRPAGAIWTFQHGHWVQKRCAPPGRYTTVSAAPFKS